MTELREVFNDMAELKSQLTEKDKQIEELKKELEQAKKVQIVEHFEAYGQCRDSRRIANLEAQIEKMKKCANCNTWISNADIKNCKYCPNIEGAKVLRHSN